MSRENQNKGDVGKRGMIAYCPKCGRLAEDITYDAEKDVCYCPCGWSNFDAPTCTNLHEPSNSEQEIIEMAQKLLDAFNERQGEVSMKDLAEVLYNAGYRRQSQNVTDINAGNKSEWISVDERLPEEDFPKDTIRITIRCLVATKEGSIRICARKRLIIKGTGKFTPWEWIDNKFPRTVPTHWMPLPEAPKMKGGAE